MFLFDEVWSEAMRIVWQEDPMLHDTWCQLITDTAFDGKTVTLTAVSSFAGDMISGRVSGIISSALTMVLGFAPDITVVTEPESSDQPPSGENAGSSPASAKLENEGLAYMQLGERRLKKNDKAGALRAFCHSYKCLCMVRYKPDDFHFKTVESLKDSIEYLAQV